MIRKVVAVWICLVMLFGFVAMVDTTMDLVPVVNGAIIIVNETGDGGAYATIQDAINASSYGDTVFVYNGEYHEHVVVNKSIKLMGQDRHSTIINGSLNGTVVSVEADDVHISRFTITDSGWDVKYGNKGYEYGSGIVIHSNGNIVEDCYFQNIQKMPIYFPDSTRDNIILSNSFNGEYMNGMRFEGIHHNDLLIRNNSFFGPIYGIVVYCTGDFADVTIQGNHFHGERWIGISIRNGERVIIKDNHIQEHETGIKLLRTQDSIVFSNTLFNNSREGIKIEDSTDNIIYHNNFLNNTNHAEDSENNTWNLSYPYGGNFWSDYTGEDKYSGENQSEPGSDGIGDEGYSFDSDNYDSYPMMEQCDSLLTLPSQVQNLTTVAQDSNVMVTWWPPEENGDTPIIKYRIYRGTTPVMGTYYAETGGQLIFQDFDVTNGINYFYKVSAINLIGEGPESEMVRALPATVPSRPQIRSGQTGDSFVNLSWRPPTDSGGLPITSYHIHRGTTSRSISYFTTIEDDMFFNDTSVRNGITYHYQVVAQNSRGESELSFPLTVTPHPTEVPTPDPEPDFPWAIWLFFFANIAFLIIFVTWKIFKDKKKD